MQLAVWRDGEPVHLTPTEFDILNVLGSRPGVVFTRERLLSEVWGYDESFGARTVDSHVAELRRRIEHDPANPRFVKTVWKVGYRFER